MTDQPERTVPPDRPVALLTTLEPGSMLGSFRLLSILGEGGMGRVFVAEDTKLGRKVALKVMKPDVAKDERARKMFLREARSAASIGHDRIVTIYEANEAAGVPYIAMELLAGEPLDKFLARTPCPPLAVTLTIAYQVAEGLHVAHEKGLIHRDIKPANVWLRATPGKKGIDVRLLDFGLARAAAGDTLSTGGAGKALGTPLYMAPEQWDGKGVDHQSDVYSLGVMLYQMLTGRPPFNGESIKELMFQICMLSVVPDAPALLNSAIPEELSVFVMRMIAKDKAKRVPTADGVVRVLERLPNAAGESTMVPEAKSNEKPWWVVDTTGLHDAREVTATVTPAKTKPRSVGDGLARSGRTNSRDRKPAVAERRSSNGKMWLVVAGTVLFAAVVSTTVILSVGASKRETAKKDVSLPPDSGVIVPPPSTFRDQNPPPTAPTDRPPPTRLSPPVEPPTQPSLAVSPPPRPSQPVEIPKPTPKVRPSLLDCTGPSGASAIDVKKSQQEWADYLGLPVETRVDLGGGVSMEFVLVPPGKFLMGTTKQESNVLEKVFPNMTKASCDDELLQHVVTITKPMYVGETEVTRAQFARHTPSHPKEGEKPDWPANDTHPVVNVSWNGAKEFAAWVGGRDLPPRFRHVRLPTEAEWEYFSRAGTRSRYPNGSDDPESLATFANVCDASAKKLNPRREAITADDGYPYSSPAKSYRPNQFGLYDTIGNAWEWCEDKYETTAYKSYFRASSDPFVRPILDRGFTEQNRSVMRGASWSDAPWFARSTKRNWNDDKNRRLNFVGCRLFLPQDSD